jgi:trehalose 6-phosphate phosphatase
MSLPEPLSTSGGAALEPILESPSETLVASDFDGTLAPIVDDTKQACADPEVVAALGRLGEHIGTVVVITGRPARTAVRLGRFREVAGLGSMIVVGEYGVERWDAAADEYRLPPNPPEISAVTDELPKILDSLGPGEALIEDKGRAVAVHTRSLPDPKGALATLADPLTDLADRHGLVSTPGKNVWEIHAPGIDKGATLRAIVEETNSPRVIFVGDDLGDLPAFAPYASWGTTGWQDCSCVLPRTRRMR